MGSFPMGIGARLKELAAGNTPGRQYVTQLVPSRQPGGNQTKGMSKMARHSTTLIDTTGKELIPLDDIPDDVKAFVEQVWAKQRKTRSRERVTYDNDTERDTEFKQIVSYVAQRPAKIGGVLAVRRSPSKDMPAHTMDIRFSADLPENAKANANRESGNVSR